MSESKNSFDAEKIVDQIKELVKKGNVSKIIVKHGEDTILNIPLNPRRVHSPMLASQQTFP